LGIMENESTKLTDKQQRFVEEYCKDCNATQAAIRAGYSEHTARSQGQRLLTNVDIRGAISARLKDLSLPAEEVTKLITDIARGDIKDYYSIREIEEPTKIEKPLAEVIEELREEMAFEEEYAQRAGLDEEEMKKHKGEQRRRQRKIIRYEMELERNPAATLLTDGPAKLVRRAELDMVKLVEDKEGGRIKAVVPSEFGLKIELYPADAALDKLARMHGLYEKDNEQSKAAPVIQAEVRILPSEAKIAGSEKEVEL